MNKVKKSFETPGPRQASALPAAAAPLVEGKTVNGAAASLNIVVTAARTHLARLM